MVVVAKLRWVGKPCEGRRELTDAMWGGSSIVGVDASEMDTDAEGGWDASDGMRWEGGPRG